MVGLTQFRSFMKAQAEAVKEKKSVHSTGESLQDALKQASLELGIRIGELEYEILQKGKKAFFGRKSSDWLILAYKKAEARVEEVFGMEGDLLGEDLFEEPEIQNCDGRFFVHLKSDGAYVKVYPEKGDGSPVELVHAIEALHGRAIHDIDNALLENALRDKSAEWIRVGNYIYNPSSDALISVDVDPDEMKAFLLVSPPGPGGADLDKEEIINFLDRNGIIFGVDEDGIESFMEEPVYKEPFLVARGQPLKNGADARIIYLFETDTTKVKLKESKDGKVDFKQLNLIQNVVEGQPLAKKVPPEPGKDGQTIRGRMLPARDGNDIEFGLGKNVSLADNGRMVKASSNGQVLLINNKITVETVMVIPGDVSTGSGNVSGLGTVIVKGNVQDGFSVTAQANIEIHGFVGNATLEAGGDIVVHKGINGRGGSDEVNTGHVRADQSLWAKFITNADVSVGENVVVSDGIVNSQITANQKVLCRGKRAKIVGGRVRAAEEINAATLGSVGGVVTLLEVGYDPEAKEELILLEDKREILEKQLNEIDRNLQSLIRQKKTRKKLSTEKETYLKEKKAEHNRLRKELMALMKDINARTEHLDNLRLKGKIAASGDIYPGVKITIKEAQESINRLYRATTFVQEGGFVKTRSYEDIDESLIRR